MEHPWGKEIQVCSNEDPRVMYGPHPRGFNFYKVIYKEMLKKSSSQELLHHMGQYLAWIFPRTRGFKSVQIKSLGSQMATP